MEYNSVRPKLVLKEYGRHVQSIVENCLAEKDPERRNQFAKEIIELMGQLNPHLRNVDDFKHKLWDHLFIMSDYQLQVDSPYPIKKREEIEKKPERLPYPQSRIRYKHYGKNVEKLVEKCVATEDPEKQAAFTQCIGNFMKLVYQNWSKEEVNDLTIKNDVRLISKGQLEITEDQDIGSLARANKFKPSNNNNMMGGNGNRNKNKHRNNRNKNFKKRR
ncbi:MAG: DUF4290 domain-containing protein [Chitinophagales bacterium]|nr:DUF4290 domain-containing protein [Chitinophagales bacterium]